LKVGIVTSFPDDPGAPHGGVEAVSVHLVRALAQFDDLDVHVVTAGRSCSSATTERWERVTLHRLPWAGGSVLRNATGAGRRQMQAYLRELKPDVIHAHDTYGLMVTGVKVPHVFTIHGFIHVDTALRGGVCSMVRSTLWRWVETRGWAKQPNIISISPYVRDRLTGIARGAIYAIDNPVSDTFYHVDRNECKGVIFSAACISRLKNPLALLKALACLREEGCEAELHLAGTCQDADYEKCLVAFIREHDLSSKVKSLGSLTAPQIHEELSCASIFALTSLHENAPLSIAEAMAVGMPVVTSNRCGMPYMVRHGESGFLVDPNDPHDIARRLRQLLESDELRRSMGAKGKEIALDRFHPAKVAARTREVYLQAMEDFHRK